jgi:hypothetical protein
MATLKNRYSELLIDASPEIALEWHPTKNVELELGDITNRSNKEVWWQCLKNKTHEWEAIVANRTRPQGGGCPFCANKKLSPDRTNSLAVLYPELATYWHPTRNAGNTIYNVVGGGSISYYWKCKICDFEYFKSIHEITGNQKKGYGGNGCPACRGLVVTENNCMMSTHPHIAELWDYEKNGDVTPKTITAFSGKTAFWKCKRIPRHKWSMKISEMTGSTIGCKFCKMVIQKSMEEMIVLFELKSIWPHLPPEGKVFPRRLRGPHHPNWTSDIFIPEINLAIEYDGAYFHSHNDKEANDIRKWSDITDLGIDFMHIREEPLDVIDPKWDIRFSGKDFKQLVDRVLQKIVELKPDSLRPATLRKIEIYHEQSDLQNEEAREDFITKVMQIREERKYFATHPFLDFDEARSIARSLCIQSSMEWFNWVQGKSHQQRKIPNGMPHNPDNHYKNRGWKGWKDWLNNKKPWMSFDEARNFVRKLNLKDTHEWRAYIKGKMVSKSDKPTNIPNTPSKVYKKEGWTNMADWLGNDNFRWVESRKKAKQKSDVLKG